MRLYVQAGVIAEGPTDLRFLSRLVDRMLPEICSSICPGNYEIAETIPLGAGERRDAEAIARIVKREFDRVLLFILHGDGAGDFARVMNEVIDPKIEAAREACPERTVIVTACVPVRETEAWMIADPDVFRTVLSLGPEIECPRDPEADLDPKATLRRLLGPSRYPKHVYELFGENVRLSQLRQLSAFCRFEGGLGDAVGRLRQEQGIR